MSRSLARSPQHVLAIIPPAGAALPEGWWHRTALPAIADVEDVETAQEVARRVAALARYVKDRHQRFELDAARLVAEVRIGELLGPGVQGRHLITTHGKDVPPQDRNRFRDLAAHKALVLRLLGEGIASRRRVLARILRSPRPPLATDGIELRLGDFRTVLDDLRGSVDAIVTDPPYGREFLPLYADLSDVAAALLRPGGICAVMVGQVHLPDVIAFLDRSLAYRWTLAYLTGGAATAVHAPRVQTYWKPVLIYERLPVNLDHRIGGDVIRAGGGDTDPTDHRWGQNLDGMTTLVARLTAPEDLIVDPFCGGGTTLDAAQRLRRRAVGCDVDARAVAAARERLRG